MTITFASRIAVAAMACFAVLSSWSVTLALPGTIA